MQDRSKPEAMDDLFSRAVEKAKTVCGPQTCLIWGEGPLDARIVFVGEAPGEWETRLRRPFAGQAGKLFDRELKAAGIDRTKCWTTNAVKCRPALISPSGRTINRPPCRDEIAGWLPFLIEELEIIRPAVTVCLGSVAAKALIDKGFAIGKQRGKWHDGPSGRRTMATFHPSYLNRVPAALKGFREDLAEVKRMSKGPP